MSKLKIEHGASKVNWVLLKTNVEESISADIDLMCQWSNNERKYIVNELLRFALAQSEEFQSYKAERQPNVSKTVAELKIQSTAPKSGHDAGPKQNAVLAPAVSRAQ